MEPTRQEFVAVQSWPLASVQHVRTTGASCMTQGHTYQDLAIQFVLLYMQEWPNNSERKTKCHCCAWVWGPGITLYSMHVPICDGVKRCEKLLNLYLQDTWAKQQLALTAFLLHPEMQQLMSGHSSPTLLLEGLEGRNSQKARS